jgi:hypothetical protein
VGRLQLAAVQVEFDCRILKAVVAKLRALEAIEGEVVEQRAIADELQARRDE